jgi:putative transposase
VDSKSYKLNHLILRIPTTPRHFIYLTLRASDYHLSYIDDMAFKKGSVTITDRTLGIALSKDIAIMASLGNIGVDVNERNVTVSDTLGNASVHDTSKVSELKERYKAIRTKVCERTRQDRRVSQKLYARYGRREQNRTVQVLHRISKRIVQQAKEKHLGIVMERLKGIRRLYRKGNGKGRSYRGRMNSWTFHEVQRQIEYKARWEGIPIT